MALQSNWRQHADRMRALGSALPAAMAQGTKLATEILHVRSKLLLNQLIYSIPEDRTGFSYKRGKGANVGHSSQAAWQWKTDATGKRSKYTHIADTTGGETKLRRRELGKVTGDDTVAGGQKKWRRTGNLRRSEKMRILNAFEGLVINDAMYALPRHDLGIPAGDPRAINGSERESSRIAPWRKQAIADTRDARLQAHHDALYGTLSRGAK